ncbi:transglycosylase domain-containing protein [Pontibacter sp. JH31]|uniref:Transglycosylase domain-containing protein n=1 Tax=Pontibacter aquaedesilientis TaxID=2766980 RepID=A0ABR7XKF3_9BACT|nr:transglycosylase domain-containing protein [Pontibacter aquaedesilientis]MBD1398774.1 transglycosylase domain-containing protein [Pontibacter aquaedesilientis]
MKKRLLIGAGVLLGLFLLLIVSLFVFRSRLLNYTINRVVEKVESRYPVDFTIGEAGFTDLTSVVLSDITMVPHGQDTLFRTDSVHAKVGLGSLFRGRIVLRELKVANGYLTAIKDGGRDNFSFLLKSDETQPVDTTAKSSRNYGELLNRILETAFDNVPDQVDFSNLNVSYTSPNRIIDIRMPYLTIEDGDINSQVSIRTDSLINNMRVKGTIDARDYNIMASLYASDNQGIRLPYVKEKFDGVVAFDTLHLGITDKTFRRDKLTVKGSAMVNNLMLNHEKLADEDIYVKEGAVDYVVSLGQNLFVIDSLTQVRVNKAKANVYASYSNADSKIIDLKVKTEALPANDFFESLPTGLFETLEGIRAEGKLQYKMKFHVNLDSVERVVFDSDLDASKDFRIVQWGKANLEKLKGPFMHTMYEYGKPIRTFMVGPANPFYVPLNQISPYLRNAVLTAEDAGFYKHKGFHEEAFRQAIATNIKKKEFVRGGSTISMQLVKNVFLTRKKTVSRKVEEAVIVWLIENLQIVSKSRMFEIYLNIIEWGPDVYGAKDASRFYFGKQPSELNLAESIFLTSIIPSPKRFRSSFDSYGNLRSWKSGYYRLIGGIMARRGLISQAEYENLYPNVRLYGRARDLIVTAPDANYEDTTEFELETIDLLDF